MSVQFNEEPSRGTFRSTTPKGITGFIIKTSFAKDVKQANMLMLGIIGVMAIIFFISIYTTHTPTNENAVDPELIDQTSVHL